MLEAEDQVFTLQKSGLKSSTNGSLAACERMPEGIAIEAEAETQLVRLGPHVPGEVHESFPYQLSHCSVIT